MIVIPASSWEDERTVSAVAKDILLLPELNISVPSLFAGLQFACLTVEAVALPCFALRPVQMDTNLDTTVRWARQDL